MRRRIALWPSASQQPFRLPPPPPAPTWASASTFRASASRSATPAGVSRSAPRTTGRTRPSTTRPRRFTAPHPVYYESPVYYAPPVRYVWPRAVVVSPRYGHGYGNGHGYGHGRGNGNGYDRRGDSRHWR